MELLICETRAINCEVPDCTACPAFCYVISLLDVRDNSKTQLEISAPYESVEAVQAAIRRVQPLWVKAFENILKEDTIAPETRQELH